VSPEDQMQSPLETVRRYFDALEDSDVDVLRSVLHPDVVQIEYPNQLSRKGSRRDLKAMMEGFHAGKRVVTKQRYEIKNSIVDGEKVSLEVTWTATMAVPVLGKAAGEELRAFFAVFISLKDDRIIRQVNYDCFLP
jgi:ketosteroid isomerase-like protein